MFSGTQPDTSLLLMGSKGLAISAQAKGYSLNVAEGHKQEAINMPDGYDAVNLRVAEQYVGEFGKLAKTSTAMIIPSNMSDIGGMVTSLSNLLERGKSGAGP